MEVQTAVERLVIFLAPEGFSKRKVRRCLDHLTHDKRMVSVRNGYSSLRGQAGPLHDEPAFLAQTLHDHKDALIVMPEKSHYVLCSPDENFIVVFSKMALRSMEEKTEMTSWQIVCEVLEYRKTNYTR